MQEPIEVRSGEAAMRLQYVLWRMDVAHAVIVSAASRSGDWSTPRVRAAADVVEAAGQLMSDLLPIHSLLLVVPREPASLPLARDQETWGQGPSQAQTEEILVWWLACRRAIVTQLEPLLRSMLVATQHWVGVTADAEHV